MIPKTPPGGDGRLKLSSKLYSRIELRDSPVVAELSKRAHDPLFIACPGPSSGRIDPAGVIGQGAIFRMNTFFYEQAPQFGSIVDGYFWSVNIDALYDGLEAALGKYDIRAFFSPLKPARADKDGAKLARYDKLFTPASDHWALMATVPLLGREMMGRPLPTQAFQVVAAAAIMGFRDIHLIGVDMYSDPTRRYVFDYPEDFKKRVDAKHFTPGYEAGAHGVERDLLFLEAIRSEFPSARIYNASDVSPLRRVLPDSPLMEGRGVRARRMPPQSVDAAPSWADALKARLPTGLRAPLGRVHLRLRAAMGSAVRVAQRGFERLKARLPMAWRVRVAQARQRLRLALGDAMSRRR